MTSSHSVPENLAITQSLIKIAVDQQSDLVLLPEMFATIGLQASDKIDVSEPFGDGPIQDFLAKQAMKYGLWIVGGTIPIKGEKPKRILLNFSGN